jgi:hypothetical protein
MVSAQGPSRSIKGDVFAPPRSAEPRELENWGVTEALAPQGRSTPERGRQLEIVPPRAYKGLQTGPEFGIDYVANQTLPISQSEKLLRSLSPFTIQVEAPLVFGNIPPETGKNKRKRVGVFEAAAAASDHSFSYSRQRIAQTPYSRIGYGGSVEEVIARNSSGVQNQRMGDDGRKTNRDGANGSGGGRLGEPAIVDLQVAVDIAMQVSAIVGTPPLVFLINPQSLQITTTKIQQFTERSRHGYIFQAWGEDQPVMAISARIGAYMSSGRGLQFASRRDSAAYQNLMSVVHFYKNNGYIHDTVGRSNAHHHVGALSIRYDQWVYYGHMQSLSFSTDDTTTQLGGLTFELQFVVSAMLDTSQNVTVVQPMRAPLPSLSDPRYFGRNSRAANEEGVLTVGDVGSADRFVAGFTGIPPLQGQGVGAQTSGVRTTSRGTGAQGFQPAASPVAAPAQQVPTTFNPGQVLPFGLGTP